MNKWIDVSFAAALGASLAFHGASISAPKVYQWITGTTLPSFNVLLKKAPPPKVSFQFIDSPDKVFESEKAKETDRISDKETIARDKKIDEKKQPLEGPSTRKGKNQQLAKQDKPNVFINKVQGKPIPRDEFITPLDEIKDEVKDEAKEEGIKKEIAELLKSQKERAKQKREEQAQQNLIKYGNAPQTRQVSIYNPGHNPDTYQSEAIEKFIATAVNIGETSFNAKKHVLGPYLKALKSRIAPLWRLKLDSQSIGSFLNEKKVTIGMKLLPDGRLGALLILRDYGDDLFNKVCLDTIIDSAPFEKLPPEWMERSGLDYLNLIYTFTIY